MTRRVLLHVGTPKTGTSYVQDVLFRNTETLAAAGIRYPADRFDAHFLAALDLLKLPWGGLESEAVGAWQRLAEQVRAHPGTSIVSHEILAIATATQADRALRTLGHDPADPDGSEVHLVLSVRDLARQIPAEWQENVKHRSHLKYDRFLEQVRDPGRDSRIGSWFWGVQEIPAILDRWGHSLPPERIHLVTVPPPGGAPELLWKRFSHALGLDGLDLDLEAERANPSLGAPETTLLRRLNKVAARDLPPAHYRPLVRELLAHQTLSARTRSPRLALPPALHAWVAGLTELWIEALEHRGYDVVGDLHDLVPTEPGDWVDPDRPSEQQVAWAAVDGLRAVLLEAVRLREVEQRLTRERDDALQALGQARTSRLRRLKERLYRRLAASGSGRRLLAGYRALRGSSSRSA